MKGAWETTETLASEAYLYPYVGEERMAYLGMACLADELDKKVLIVLRDGRNLIGTLRSFDQFANILLDLAFERVIVDDKFCDVPLGVFLIRGENVMLMGELDVRGDYNQTALTRVSIEEIFELQKSSKRAAINFDIPLDDGI